MSKPESSINYNFIDKLITQILKATEKGTSLKIEDPDQVGQFVFAILGLGAGLIPVVGSSLGALCNLFGTIIFPGGNSTEKLWEKLRERVEKLVDEKIAGYHVEILKQKIAGFQANWELYSRYLKDFEDASPGDKAHAADTLKSTHIAFMSVLLAGIPEFQVDAYAVASLPLFALVATMYLTLLVDGIQRGESWGYTSGNVATMKALYTAKTTSSGWVSNGNEFNDLLQPSSAIEEAISIGAQEGIREVVLSSWKDAHVAL